MDGLSIAASIAGIASLTLEVTHILYKYYSDVESAPKDIESLKREAEALSKVLKQLEIFLNREGVKGNSFDQTASVLASTLKDCRTTLDNLEKGLTRSIKESFPKVFGRLMWPFRKDQVEKMVDSLRRYNQIFQFSLTVEGWSVPKNSEQCIFSDIFKWSSHADIRGCYCYSPSTARFVQKAV